MVISYSTTLSKSGPGINNHEKVFHIPLTLKTGASPQGVVSYQDTLFEEARGVGGSYQSTGGYSQHILNTAGRAETELKSISI